MSRSFTASRWAGGSFLLPAQIEITPGGVRYTKRGIVGGSEELIHFAHIASVRLNRGVLHTTISIETSGGSAPIVIAGLRSSDAREIRDAIEAAQMEK
jgi:hypothetical protein